jgi:hypothetical protein
MSFDLKSYLDRFAEVCELRYGHRYNFGAVEKRLAQLREGKRWLVAKDVIHIFNHDTTPHAGYWKVPSEKELDMALRKQRLYLSPLPADVRPLVQQLVNALGGLSQASVVLRFVHPERFGIFSITMTYLLQIQRPTAMDLFVAFCEELSEWRKQFRLSSVAETEMALWAYDQISRGIAGTVEAEKARRGFEDDIWIQRRHTQHALAPILRNHGPLELARILLPTTPVLAAMIAAAEYERLLRVALRRFYRQEFVPKKGAVESLLDRLAGDGYLSLEHVAELRRIWQTRNKAVHLRDQPTFEEVEVMIDRVELICQPWERQRGS